MAGGADKRKAVLALLAQMDTIAAAKLAKFVETARASNPSDDVALTEIASAVPVDDLLSALRPRLRAARPARVPDLRRLVCDAFELLLVDAAPGPEDTGTQLVASGGQVGGRPELAMQPRAWMISRKAIGPAWALVQAAGLKDLAIFEARLAQAVARQDTRAMRSIRESLAPAVASVLEGAILSIAAKQVPRPMLDALRPALAAGGIGLAGCLSHMAKMVAPLRYHAELSVALDQLVESAQGTPNYDGERIVDLDLALLRRVKAAYLDLSELIGPTAYLLPMMMMRRMARPWQMLQLPASLSHSGMDTALRESDLGGVLELLVAQAEQLARKIDSAFPQEMRQFGGAYGMAKLDVPTAGRLAADVAQCAALSNGVLGQTRFSPTSAWRQRLADVQRQVSVALESGMFVELRALAIAPFLDRDWLGRHGDAGRAGALAAIAALVELVQTPGEKGIGAVAQSVVRGMRSKLAQALEEAVISFQASSLVRSEFAHPAEQRLELLRDLYVRLYSEEDSLEIFRRAEGEPARATGGAF